MRKFGHMVLDADGDMKMMINCIKFGLVWFDCTKRGIVMTGRSDEFCKDVLVARMIVQVFISEAQSETGY
jgi:hypothetical protein